jgi:N-carbamoyl-L-amino-acid hydrolase
LPQARQRKFEERTMSNDAGTTRNLTVDGARLWASLMEMARIGATDKGGVCRLALTDLDRESRDLFVRWCEDAGCSVRVDPMGNIFARRAGRDASLPPVATGSHLDSQPTGGRFDGVYGVLAGLEVIRTLNDHDVHTAAPVELVVWTNEEGARFPPAMVGSGVYAGVFDLDYGHSRQDLDGKRLGEELERIGYKGDAAMGEAFGAFFETHIEQGPILEAAGHSVGVVTGAQGTRWYDVVLTGAECHAGPTPMERRRDALAAAAALLARIYALAHDNPPHGRATVGEFRCYPGSRNTVPGRVELTVDLRHPDASVLETMHAGLGRACEEVAAASGVQVALDLIWDSPPVAFDADCIAAVRRGAELLGYSHMDAVSGAGHDAVYISRITPTAMVFIPCEDGISHNESENATPEHVTAGANVLLHAMLEKAGV